ncbi:MAG: SCP2 sterol-binding domain-containing protein [Gammaproteobacteria bacterium]|nr:SCP2 sterol-binding domain-containing protein [Gammaproteobacteria bacterium]
MINKKWVTHELVQRGPKGIGALLKITPQWISLGSIERVLNLFFQPECAAGELDFINDHAVRIEVSDLDLQFVVALHARKLKVHPAHFAHAATFRGSSQDLLLLITQRVDPDTLFFRRRLSIQGDTELALQLKNLLDTIELESRLPKPLVRITAGLAEAVETHTTMTN